MKEEILKIFEDYKGSYKGFQAKVFLFKNNEEDWQNFFTLIEAVYKGDNLPEEKIDDYNSNYKVGQITLDNCKFMTLIEGLVEKNELSFPKLPTVRLEGNFVRHKNYFNPSKALVTSHEWPSYCFVYDLKEKRYTHQLRETLFSPKYPLYPSLFSAVQHLTNFDIERFDTLQGTCIFVLPVYKVRIDQIRISSSIKIVIETKEVDIKNILGKIVFYDRKSVISQMDLDFKNHERIINRPSHFESFDLIIYEKDNRVILDKRKYNPGWSERVKDIKFEQEDDNVRNWIANGENEHIEFKQDLNLRGGKNEFIETVVAMANKSGGVIIIGVNNNGIITGFRLDNEDQITNIIRSNTEPFIDVKIENRNIDDMSITLFHISEGNDKPYLLKDKGPYIRRGATDRIMTRYELDEICSQKNDRKDKKLPPSY